jgi:flagellar assembly factor FliW
VAVFAIVTLPSTPDDPWTANLQGPLIFNARTRRAVQHVIPDGAFGVRHPLPPDAIG